MATPITGTCGTRRSPPCATRSPQNFVARAGEVGAGVSVVIDGRTVVDLAGGWADEARTRPWQTDTLVNVYSVGKAFIGLLALQLVDQGRIDLDAPIAEVWPGSPPAARSRPRCVRPCAIRPPCPRSGNRSPMPTSGTGGG